MEHKTHILSAFTEIHVLFFTKNKAASLRVGQPQTGILKHQFITSVGVLYFEVHVCSVVIVVE